MKSVVLLLLATGLVIFSCSKKTAESGTTIYPATARTDIADTLFGERVADPYRWLENDTTKQTAAWVAAENKVTFAFLEKIPYRNEIKSRLEKVINYERLSAPTREGDYTYFYKNDGLQNQNVLYREKNGSEAEMFLDPNSFSSDGTTRLVGASFSKDGSRLAIQISRGGADWTDAVIMMAADKKLLEDTLRDIKFSGISWKGNDGFYYSTYKRPKGSQLTAQTQHHTLYYHKVGTPRTSDAVIFGGEKTPRRYIGGYLTEDERYLVVTAATTTTGNELYIQDLRSPGSKLIRMVDDFESINNIVDNHGDELIIATNWKAPNVRLVKVSAAHPEREHWKDLVPEKEQVMEFATTAGGSLFLTYLVDAQSVVKQFDRNGKLVRDVKLPGIGTAMGFGGKAADKEVYYTFTSFTYPPAVFKYDVASGASTLYAQPKVEFDPAAYETKQVFYASKDGTKIPMFITFRKGLELNGKNPTLLYAYGGFNISMTPNFSASRVVWLENGGVYAQPCLRGGGEYGEKWHLAGTRLNKQNVFDDFIAAAEFLIREKYTSSNYLAISGGSNGGLLIGATMTQRPDLAKVALPAVGVMDMLRYHKFTAGAGWAYDYGTAEDSKEMFEYLRKYSPVHALKAGTSYPATLITTADHDDRVVPAHSFKFAATLQEDQAGSNPVLIRIDTKSGHSSSNLHKAIESTTDQYAFAWYEMGIIPPLAKKGI